MPAWFVWLNVSLSSLKDSFDSAHGRIINYNLAGCRCRDFLFLVAVSWESQPTVSFKCLEETTARGQWRAGSSLVKIASRFKIWLKEIQMSPENARQCPTLPTAAIFRPMPTRATRPNVHRYKKDGWYGFQKACSCNPLIYCRHRAKVLQKIGSVSFVPSGVYFIFFLLPHSSAVGSLRFDDFEFCSLGAISLRGARALTGFCILVDSNTASSTHCWPMIVMKFNHGVW